nr:adenine methyltransferase [Elusimicrobiota bacterium]
MKYYKIHTVKIANLKPSEYNPRRWNQKAICDLTTSIQKFGLVDPIIANSARNRRNIVVGGHFRLQIAKDLGFKEVPVVYVNIPDFNKEKELNIRLNKNSGEWDYDLLANFDEELLLDVGFEPAELDKVFELEISNKDPDAIPDVPKKPKAKLGDVYQLGDHRLMCGDSTDLAQVQKLLGKNKTDMLFTDPPYNVNYSGKGKNTSNGIKNDSLSKEEFDEFISKVFANMNELMNEGSVYYVCSGWSSYPVFYENLIKQGFYRAGVIIWVKDNAGMGWNDYRYKHEWILVGKKKKKKVLGVPILYGWKEGSHYFRDSRDECDVWEVPRKNLQDYKHPTEKPVWLIEKALVNSSKRYDKVLDLFGGSGSALIACERLSRQCFIMEYDTKYVDVIIKRWEDFTGKKAKLIDSVRSNKKK